MQFNALLDPVYLGPAELYNVERLHQALGYACDFRWRSHVAVDDAPALNGCGVAHRLLRTEFKRELTHVA